MNKNVELINELISQAEQMAYGNNLRDAVEKRAEMLIRKIFGNQTHYLQALKDIRYTPSIVFSGTPRSNYETNFNSGKRELINLLKVIAEDIELDLIMNNSSLDSRVDINSTYVFVVHGHNEEMKLAVARTIEKLNLNPIILHEQASKGKTIIEKFTDTSEVIFAIVLLSGDDIAYKKGSSIETAKYRARQNVIFELGYFIGKLGREKVLALHEIDIELELPSDYNGVLFVPFDRSGKWQFELVKELKAIGLNVDANAIL